MITRIAIQSLLALWLLSLFVLVPVRRGVGGWSDYGLLVFGHLCACRLCLCIRLYRRLRRQA